MNDHDLVRAGMSDPLAELNRKRQLKELHKREIIGVRTQIAGQICASMCSGLGVYLAQQMERHEEYQGKLRPKIPFKDIENMAIALADRIMERAGFGFVKEESTEAKKA